MSNHSLRSFCCMDKKLASVLEDLIRIDLGLEKDQIGLEKSKISSSLYHVVVYKDMGEEDTRVVHALMMAYVQGCYTVLGKNTGRVKTG